MKGLRSIDDPERKVYIVARRVYDVKRKCFYTEYTRAEKDLKHFCEQQMRRKLYVGVTV